MNRIVNWRIIFFYLVISVSFVEAQVGSAAPAILARGPIESVGFPLIYPNAVKSWVGYYRYLELEIKVSFTRENIMIPAELEKLTCDKIKGFRVEDGSFLYKDTEWSLLFEFSPEFPLDCVFINTFIIRLKYFLRDSSILEPPLFPAILEF